jgi:hypothetical protein
MTAVSMGGLLFPTVFYPSDELLRSFLANDAANLIIGLPILLVSLWLTRRGSLFGLLSWPGVLLYVVYNYVAYLFGMPFGWTTLASLALVALSAYAIFYLMACIDRKSVQEQLSGAVLVKTGGWFLVVFGVLFVSRAIGMLAQGSLPASGTGILIADMVLSTLWIACGSLLLRRNPLGYASGLGMLIAASMLFIGLILFLLLQPVLTSAPFALMDVMVVLGMGMICSIPTILFARGVILRRKIL